MRNRLTYDNKVDLIYILLRDSELNKWQFLEVVGQLSAMLRMLIALLSEVERFFVFVFVQNNSPETAGVAVNEAVKCNRLVPLLVGYYMFDSSKLGSGPICVKTHPQSSMRWRRRANVARPYICLLMVLSLLTLPSVCPLLSGRLSAASTAVKSRRIPCAN